MSERIVIVSDTHGLVRDQLVKIIETSDLVVHAGDLDNLATLEKVRELGVPVKVARGNCDYGAWASSLPDFELFEFAGMTFYVRHIPWMMDIDPVAAGVDIVVTGHTHQVDMRVEDGVRFLNPGSAGPSYARPATAMIVTLNGIDINVDVVTF
jgi:putative phosphoesterase